MSVIFTFFVSIKQYLNPTKRYFNFIPTNRHPDDWVIHRRFFPVMRKIFWDSQKSFGWPTEKTLNPSMGNLEVRLFIAIRWRPVTTMGLASIS